MSTYFRTNDSTKYTYAQQSRRTPLDACSTADYTQPPSYKNTTFRNKENEYTTSWLSEKTTADNLAHQGSRGSEPEEFMISDRSHIGIDTSYLQNQNVSLISKNNGLCETQKEVDKILKNSGGSFVEPRFPLQYKPQSCQNKLESSMRGFKGKECQRRQHKRHHRSPSEVDSAEADEGQGIIPRNRERLDSSIIRTRKNSLMYKESFISANNFLCQTIAAEDKIGIR